MAILAWNIPSIPPIFLKRSLVFPILLFSSISLHCSFKKVYLSLLFSGALHSDGYIFPFLPCLSHHFFPQVFIKSPQTTTLPSCISFSLRCFWSLTPVKHYEPPSIVLQAFCLPDLIPWIYSSPPLYKEFDLGHTWMGLVVFPTLLNLSLNFAIRSSWSEPQSFPGFVFADCIDFLHL